MLRLAAPWLLPIDGPPVADGALLIDDAGKIVAVGPAAMVPVPERAQQLTISDAALLPGLVNTHTHLELTGFAGMVEEADFWEWILHVIKIKAARHEEEFFLQAQAGIRACWASGVTTVCDTGSTGQVIAALKDLGASGIAHHEVFGAHPDECAGAMKAFSKDLDRLAHQATGRVHLGVSPHAPYTVSGPLYRASCELARAHGVPIAVHTAEPPGESALLADFTGIFADAFTARGVPRPTLEAISPVAWMATHGVWSDRTLCIHAINVDDADADILQRHGSAVATCPRSNRRHHLVDPPLRRYVDRKLRIGIGTDSEVSVAPLDLLAEAREAGMLAGWTTRDTLRAVTLGGAEAIRLAAGTGSLTVGKWADVVAVRVPPEGDVEHAVLRGGPADVLGTWLGGRAVHGVGRAAP
ncbi:MAG: amidohydrolase family protein [Gemmatimonadales bacterium]